MVLGNGARGTPVADLQRRLAALGFAPGPIDGIYGPQTTSAVRAFQHSRGIAADGVYGPQTEAAFGQEGAGAGAPVSNPATDGVTPINPESDPQFLAFLRAQGYSEADLRAQIALQKTTIQRSLDRQLPVIADQERQAGENISKDYLGRGFYAGGEHLRDVAESNAVFDRQENTLRSTTADQVSALDAQLMDTLATNSQKRQDEELAARKRLALAQANIG